MSRSLAFALLLAAGVSAAGSVRAEVSIGARLSRNPIPAGESSTLEVTVTGAGSGVGQPSLSLPEGIQTLGTSRSQSFTWVNGKSSTQTLFRIELGADRAGTFSLSPIRVTVGSQVYESPGVSLTVAAGTPRVGGATRGSPAEILVDVSPRDPYVGQPVILRVRLIQRAPLAEDPQYNPPATPGFWAERASQPTSYYADEGGSRVLVTETRARLYPLAAGASKVGEATATLVLALQQNGHDPFGVFGDGLSSRPIQVHSPPVELKVRPLPAGAPAGFDGAVGRFVATWQADRRQTPRDVAATLSLEVRGIGNLPLVHTPAFSSPHAEVFTSSAQDSLGTAGTMGMGRRRFQWTVLPRHSGTLTLAAPVLVWFDEASGRYQQATLPPISIEVTAPVGGHDQDAGGFPAAFAEHPLDPGAHPARAFGFALAGVLLGFAVARLRGALARQRDAGAPPPSWLEGLRHARGASFWAAAGRACEALEERGMNVSEWQRNIDAARFGGVEGGEDVLRKKLLARLETTGAGAARPGVMAWAIPGVAIAAALGIVVFSLPGGGSPVLVQRGRDADGRGRGGDVEGAAARWRAIWNSGARSPGLAARLAWAAERSGDAAQASAWVLRGEHGEPRDAALGWATRQVRDAGGLEGYAPSRLPIRSLECSLLALAAGLATGFFRRRWAIVLAAVAVGGAVLPTLDAARAARQHRAVVAQPVTLGGAGVDLTPGEVVRVLSLEGGRARVEAGAQVAGQVPASALLLDGATP